MHSPDCDVGCDVGLEEEEGTLAGEHLPSCFV